MWKRKVIGGQLAVYCRRASWSNLSFLTSDSCGYNDIQSPHLIFIYLFSVLHPWHTSSISDGLKVHVSSNRLGLISSHVDDDTKENILHTHHEQMRMLSVHITRTCITIWGLEPKTFIEGQYRIDKRNRS